MTREEANETYLLVKEKTIEMFPEWDEERKRRFLSVIRQKLKECANDGRSDDLRS